MSVSQRLAMVGCNHRRTSVAVRERLTFTSEQVEEALATWRIHRPDHEAVLISTCNRVEFYAAVADERTAVPAQALVRFLTDFHHVPLPDIEEEFTSRTGDEAVRHLFRVASSLDSMVVGEAQILSQVKRAYGLASDAGSAGPVLHKCFQAAIRAARRVADETKLHRHRVSIPSIALAQYTQHERSQVENNHIVVVGAGELAEKTLRQLVGSGARHIVILNRDIARASRLADTGSSRAAPWSELYWQISAADLVISATGADHPIVTLDDFRQQVATVRKGRPLTVLDLAVPRDFEAAIGHEPGVFLYDMDYLSQACEYKRQTRAGELTAAEHIVEEELQSFLADARRRASGSVITRLRRGLQSVQAAELERLFGRLPDLDDRSRQEILQFSHRLLAKILHPPLESLRDESRRGSFYTLLDSLERLFQLRDQDNQS